TIHLICAGLWAFSTSVAYYFYLVPIMKLWGHRPDDDSVIRFRNWAMERFDQGATLEHIAFPILLITGPMLLFAGGWGPHSHWLVLKLVIVVLLFIPIEVLDYHYSHLKGSQKHLRLANKPEEYEQAIHQHWLYLFAVTPLISVFVPLVLVLAILKPF
ncbi:MAG: hypothetical protein ACK5HY_15470, partial [Parahaliea sp.]